MLPEALTAVATMAGTAVVQAAGTDAWTNFRERFSRTLGRGEEQAANGELARLDRTATELASADPAEADAVRAYQAGVWCTRVELALENLEESQREAFAAELRAAAEEVVGNDSDQQAGSSTVTAVATMAGTAVVQAAGTDAWTNFRGRFSRTLGRGEEQAANGELARLDRTATELASADPAEADAVRAYQAGVWCTRVELALENLEESQREAFAAELRAAAEEVVGNVPDRQVGNSTATADGRATGDGDASGVAMKVGTWIGIAVSILAVLAFFGITGASDLDFRTKKVSELKACELANDVWEEYFPDINATGPKEFRTYADKLAKVKERTPGGTWLHYFLESDIEYQNGWADTVEDYPEGIEGDPSPPDSSTWREHCEDVAKNR
nr:hypothetical protein OH820_21735 [Streptomyces sp. NBC_00857]